MTWDQIESSWKRLKGDLQQHQRPQNGTRGARFGELESARETVEAEVVSYKRSLHHGTAFIRRRKPVQVEQAGWTAAR